MHRLTGFLIVLLVLFSACGEARVLQSGMRGLDVKELQTLLASLGRQLAVDGVFGPQTELLIVEIQRAAGLKADGIVGAQTQKVLEELRRQVVFYIVQSGDNLTLLAKRYNTTVSGIAGCNGLANPDRLLPGQALFIPTTELALSVLAPKNRLALHWPAKGSISSGYGSRIHPITKKRHFHGGIDIAVPQGTPIRAAQAGRVSEAGPAGNFGLAVAIDHGGDIITCYGHLSKILVRAGETVQRGQVIALSGCTGMATGPHVDFRIKIGGQTVDPLQYLP